MGILVHVLRLPLDFHCIHEQAEQMIIQLDEQARTPTISQLNVPHFDLEAVKALRKRGLGIGYFPMNLIADLVEPKNERNNGEEHA